MPKLTISLPSELLFILKKEAKKKDIPVSELIRHVLTERAYRQANKKDKQAWLDALYSGKPRKHIKQYEDLFSD